ncbi:hypothetical protein BGZ68_000383 [Mortierella alpina]|nr:hypothetical protein BGZ68_000383 [Mortierella alpina]
MLHHTAAASEAVQDNDVTLNRGSKGKMTHLTYEELVHDGNTSSVDGWDFSWFKGRATEERPSWGYAKAMSDRMAHATAALDIQTGGGEVLNTVENFPRLIAATEFWPPNLALASRLLAPRGVVVVAVENHLPLPFADGIFDLVVARHPTTDRSPDVTRADAQAAGLEVLDLKFERTKLEFFDVGAIIHFVRKVVWLVPDFSVEKYADKLKEMHEHIQTHQSFVAHSSRFLIVARKPATTGSL